MAKGKSISANKKAKRLLYKSTGKREENKIRKLKKVIKNNPNDPMAKAALKKLGG